MDCFLTDLDNTLIYSGEKLKNQKVCIEYRQGREQSFMTADAYESFRALRRRLLVIPVTTRSLEQYNRITLFQDQAPDFALVANGGILLKQGKMDVPWRAGTDRLVESAREELEKAEEILSNCPERSFEIRKVDDLFLFTKSGDPQKTFQTLAKTLNPKLVTWHHSLQKVYVLPRVLDKGLAVGRLRSYLNGKRIIAAGDSVFDLSLLSEADVAIGLQGEVRKGLELGLFSEEDHNKYRLFDGPREQFSEFVLDTVDQLMR